MALTRNINDDNTLAYLFNKAGKAAEKTRLLSDLFLVDKRKVVDGGSIDASSSKGFSSIGTIRIPGYKPLYGAIVGGSYCDYLSINQENMSINQSDITFGTIYFGNWSTAARTFSAYCISLWVKEDAFV